MIKVDDILKNKNLQTLWQKYNQYRLNGNKKKANTLLLDFILQLKQQDKIIRKNFTSYICHKALNNQNIISNNGFDVSNQTIRIQHPLFKEIFLPIFIDEYKLNNPEYIKWIAQLEQFFYSDITATRSFLNEINVEFPFDTTFFLKKAYTLSKERETLDILLVKLAQRINFTVHEYPFSILANPKELENEISEFKDYLRESLNKNLWNKSIKDWEVISFHWKTYNNLKEKFCSFEEYISKNKIEL